MNFLSRDFLYHRGLSKTTYRGTWNRSNVWRLQAFDYVLMFMDDESLDYLSRSAGWEFGTGPSIVVLNKGIAASATTTTLRKGIYAFIFGQKGVMAGIELQGSKIIKINPEP